MTLVPSGNSGTKGCNKWSSTAGFKDTLTGEQISRAQAIAEVSKVHREPLGFGDPWVDYGRLVHVSFNQALQHIQTPQESMDESSVCAVNMGWDVVEDSGSFHVNGMKPLGSCWFTRRKPWRKPWRMPSHAVADAESPSRFRSAVNILEMIFETLQLDADTLVLRNAPHGGISHGMSEGISDPFGNDGRNVVWQKSTIAVSNMIIYQHDQ